MKYVIPEIPPSLNKFMGRKNHWEYRKLKQEWSDLVVCCCRPIQEESLAKAVVTLTYYFPTKARRDPDNYNGKMILDGLVRAGIIKDDSFENIELRLKGGHDKSSPRTEIEITKIDIG